MPSLITAVIPTRNRPADLVTAVVSVLAQGRTPDELLVVDQSPGVESREAVEALLRSEKSLGLRYVHDPAISGLVEAKSVAVREANGDIVCFLEDDVILEPGYIGEIERGFLERSDMLGCSGVITNPPRESSAFVFFHRIFFRGIFRDPRVGLFGRRSGRREPLVRCDVLSGGLSAWRREVFVEVPFDVTNGFFMLEDIEFSTRVVRRFGHVLYVNTNARLEHRWTPVNRDNDQLRHRRKLSEGIAFYRKRADWAGARRGLVGVLLWWFMGALVESARSRSLAPMTGYFRGFADGLARKVVA